MARVAFAPLPSANLFSVLILGALLSFCSLLLYRAFLGPLRSVPGPLICRLTSLWTYWHSYIGDECTQINALHARYGSVVRIAPNELSLSDGAALAPIYAEKGGFLKAPCYANFDIEGHETIFSTRDPAHRAVRSKAVVAMFSTSSIRAGSAAIEGCVTRLMERMREEAAESRRVYRETGSPKPINMLNLARSLALDAVSSYLFDRPFGGISEKTDRMSATAFVDTLVAVGRFFFLPNWVFLALEMSRMKFWPDGEEDASASKVDDFVSSMVSKAEPGERTYHGRMLGAGISKAETEVQCKDLIFAGTDSTGTNLSTIVWHLAKQPACYERLRQEVLDVESRDPSYNPQSLRYLDGVVREGLRISMANPTRFPRVVPPQGFSFETREKLHYEIPAGTLVGVQPFTVHLNPRVFPDPLAFKPERWLDATSEMQRDAFPFGLGSRQCIARNLATVELFLAVRAIARDNVLAGAEAVGEKIEMLEWFNSKIKGEKIEIAWR